MYHNQDRELLADVKFVGLENYYAAKERGKGLMFITAHSGNWELLALSFGARYDPVAVVGRQMDRLYVNKILEKMRCRFGNSVIYRDKAGREILAALKANRNVGLLVDQATDAANGLKCDFLGRPAWTTKLPVKLAMKTGGALVPIFIHRENGHHVVTIHPEMLLSQDGSDEERLYRDTCRLNGYIDDYIVRYPGQWNWLYNRWKRT
jgi:KDO2-lipid IV(A) lauroyltransferase